MPRIHKLPDLLINQIAAGESVERPASVVKELIDNALDAGAGAVDVSIEKGGARLIRVEDDGSGMTAEDARLALERHATSKISGAADLTAIRTLGFRGEALPAIASVSRLLLRTAAAEGEGFRLELEAGAERIARPDAHPRGTTVEVRDLFHNTPARAKFLRTVPTELARITEIVQAAALSRPDVRFRLQHDGRELLSTPPAGDRRERVRQIFGAELAEALLPLGAGGAPLQVTGFVSLPAFTRASRVQWFLFVNDRQVHDRTISHAVTQACRSRFPRDRFPALFLFVQVPHSEVDVNVHPAKREVRFRTPGAVHDLVQRALEEALSAGPVQHLPGPQAVAPRMEAVASAVEAYLSEDRSGERATRWTAREAAAVPLPGEEIGVRVLGQMKDTYILVEDAEGLLLVDQHAAHERVLYDRHRRELREGSVARQALLFPVTVEMSPAEAARLGPLVEEVERLGFDLDAFGPNTFVVRAVPAHLAGADPAAAVRDLASGDAPIEDLEHHVTALTACHAAVRAGMRLDSGRMQRIVAGLLDGQHALTCPHGRPATLRYPLREIERAFLRP